MEPVIESQCNDRFWQILDRISWDYRDRDISTRSVRRCSIYLLYNNNNNTEYYRFQNTEQLVEFKDEWISFQRILAEHSVLKIAHSFFAESVI